MFFFSGTFNSVITPKDLRESTQLTVIILLLDFGNHQHSLAEDNSDWRKRVRPVPTQHDLMVGETRALPHAQTMICLQYQHLRQRFLCPISLICITSLIYIWSQGISILAAAACNISLAFVFTTKLVKLYFELINVYKYQTSQIRTVSIDWTLLIYFKGPIISLEERCLVIAILPRFLCS